MVPSGLRSSIWQMPGPISITPTTMATSVVIMGLVGFLWKVAGSTISRVVCLGTALIAGHVLLEIEALVSFTKDVRHPIDLKPGNAFMAQPAVLGQCLTEHP